MSGAGTSAGAAMKAAVLVAPQTFAIESASLPQLADHQVRLRVEGCGVCASSLPIYQGREWFKYPVAAGNPGHETWGTIEELGAQVRNLNVGDRVTALSYNGYAELDVADADKVVKLPAQLDGQAFPGEALGCALNIFRRSEIKAGDTVAILGIGFMGALLTQLVKHAGARVIAISRRPFSLDVAEACGADERIEMDDHERIIASVEKLTGGKWCSHVIECTGYEWPLNLAGELCANRGRLIIAGFHQDGMRQVNVQLWNWRGLDVINAHEREPEMYVQGMRDAVAAVTEGRLQPQQLYTHNFPLGDIGSAFECLDRRPDGFVKAYISC